MKITNCGHQVEVYQDVRAFWAIRLVIRGEWPTPIATTEEVDFITVFI